MRGMGARKYRKRRDAGSVPVVVVANKIDLASFCFSQRVGRGTGN